MKDRNSVWKTRSKFFCLESDEKRACIPRLIWSDGHCECMRWPWFKDDYDRIGRGQYF